MSRYFKSENLYGFFSESEPENNLYILDLVGYLYYNIKYNSTTTLLIIHIKNQNSFQPSTKIRNINSRKKHRRFQ